MDAVSRDGFGYQACSAFQLEDGSGGDAERPSTSQLDLLSADRENREEWAGLRAGPTLHEEEGGGFLGNVLGQVGVLLEAVPLQRLPDVVEDLLVGGAGRGPPELSHQEGGEGASVEALLLAFTGEVGIHRGLEGLSRRQLQNSAAAGVEARLVFLSGECPAGDRGGLGDVVDVPAELPGTGEGCHVPGAGPGVTVVQDHKDVRGRESGEPLAELVVSNVEFRRLGAHVRRGDGLVQTVVLIPAFVPHLGAVSGEEDRDLVLWTGHVGEPLGETFLDGIPRSILVQQHADVLDGEAPPFNENVANDSSIALRPGEITSRGVLEVDVIADPHDECPVGRGGALGRPKGEQGDNGHHDG